MSRKYINPNEYGSLLYDQEEEKNLINVIRQKRIFRYSKCEYPYVNMCEEKIKNIVNTDYCLMTTSGTSALKTALIAAGVKENDRVLISSYTFLATALAPIALGAIPVPIDISLNNGLDLDDLKNEIEKGCKAIIVVHFQGRTFNLKEIKKIAKEKNVVLIEDACQAFGSRYKDNYAGTFGDIGVFSFQQFKQVSCGEGGCVITNNKNYYDKMRNYTDMGAIRDRYPSWNSRDALFGENYRMNNLNAAVLYAQLEKLDDMILCQKKSREKIMAILEKNMVKNIIESDDPKGDTAMNILIMLNDKCFKEKAVKIGEEMNIELRNMWSSLYYDNLLFKESKLDSISLKNKECFNTKEIIDKMLVVSIPPTLSKQDEDKIGKLIIKLKNENMME